MAVIGLSIGHRKLPHLAKAAPWHRALYLDASGKTACSGGFRYSTRSVDEGNHPPIRFGRGLWPFELAATTYTAETLCLRWRQVVLPSFGFARVVARLGYLRTKFNHSQA